MIFVVLTFAVLFIFTMTAIFIGNSSFKHADKEENKTQAYYVAKTGVDSVISHLEKEGKGIDGDIRDELDKLIEKTDIGDIGVGNYKEGSFEIEVKKKIKEYQDKNGDKKNKTFYLVESKGKVGKEGEEDEDQVTAILTPKYQANQNWGKGTIDAGGSIHFNHISQLKGSGLILNTIKKRLHTEEGPVTFGDIMDLFISKKDKEKKVKDYELVKIIEDKTEIFSEKLINDSITDFEPLQINYGVERELDEITAPAYNSSGTIKLDNEKVSFEGFRKGKIINEKYQVIEIKDDEPKLKTKEKEIMKIEAQKMETKGDIVIETSKDRDILITVDVLEMSTNSNLNIKGDGNVYFYIKDSGDIGENSKVGANLHIPNEINTVINTHFYLDSCNLTVKGNGKVKNTLVYGTGDNSEMELKGGSIYKGRMFVEKVDFNGESTIQSPSNEESNEDSDPIVGFENIEWERGN